MHDSSSAEHHRDLVIVIPRIRFEVNRSKLYKLQAEIKYTSLSLIIQSELIESSEG